MSRLKRMFVHMLIPHPQKGKKSLLIDSMHRFGKAMEGKKGLIITYTTKNEEKNILVGLAVWDSNEDWLAARPSMINAVKDDPFEDGKKNLLMYII